MNKFCFGGFVLAMTLLGFTPIPASAQVNIFNQSERWFSLGADFGFYAGSTDDDNRANMSTVLHMGGRIHENVDLELQVPGTLHAYANDTLDESSVAFRFANPSLGAYYVTSDDMSMFRLGAFFAAPLASVPTNDLEDRAIATEAYDYAAAMRGTWNRWQWMPSTTTFGAASQLEFSPLSVLSLAADGAVAALFDTGESRTQTDILTQLALEAALKAGEILRLGARIAGVWVPTADGDNFQSFLEPFARLQFTAAYLFASLILNLDEPAGFAFDSGGVWGARLGMGVRF